VKDEISRRIAEFFYRGLVDYVSGLGPGRFDDDHYIGDFRKNSVTGLVEWSQFVIRYVVFGENGNDTLVRIHSQFRRTPQGWERFHYAHHCGPTPLDHKDTHFRIDLSKREKSAYHVHHRHYPGDHIPCSKVDPDTRDIDPFVFVDLVRKFLATGVIPLQRRP
jgi:hypothetical protein